jgi:hypothetical protein
MVERRLPLDSSPCQTSPKLVVRAPTHAVTSSSVDFKLGRAFGGRSNFPDAHTQKTKAVYLEQCSSSTRFQHTLRITTTATCDLTSTVQRFATLHFASTETEVLVSRKAERQSTIIVYLDTRGHSLEHKHDPFARTRSCASAAPDVEYQR